MTIDRHGFLAPEISRWIDHHRTANVDWFSLAEQMAKVGHSILLRLAATELTRIKALAGTLFARQLSSFQSVVVLAERGATQDARTIVRCCVETTFYLRALQKSPDFVDLLINDDKSRRGKIARALLSLPEQYNGLDDEQMTKVREFVAQLIGSQAQAIGIQDAARAAGLLGEYDVFYRGLSNDAAHPSVFSLDRYALTDASGEMVGLRWGPDVTDVQDTLFVACTVMLHAMEAAHEMTEPGNPSPEIFATFERYKVLVATTIETR